MSQQYYCKEGFPRGAARHRAENGAISILPSLSNSHPLKTLPPTTLSQTNQHTRTFLWKEEEEEADEKLADTITILVIVTILVTITIIIIIAIIIVVINMTPRPEQPAPRAQPAQPESSTPVDTAIESVEALNLSSQPSLQAGSAQQRPETIVVKYDDYFEEVMCFSSVDNRPETGDVIREYIRSLCTHNGANVHTGTIRMDRSAIPSGRWSIAFAPAILAPNSAWVIIFGAPRDSQFLWFFWSSRGGTEEHVLRLLVHLRESGKIKAEEPMKIGDDRHKKLFEIVEQAVWKDQNPEFETHWAVGEFNAVE
ncbi:hypothetical protein BU24DRAFT_466648 [Aaosphaeria arxii CBS 175.79]|uniref:Uncharacterized protein n=1 Tax=Aaosphaeria arxii CBS 175.79 TaxID=1450172 RepID=A0A6A5XDB7_9PLEO|nr:uncharacterized protein BU24DRAFT_466648 [Aaosphaeria arxii CBS 175.79]KAF2010890.1 hypothetical protein BU24DRAFT_466648 [Aaosphaeria arxii CBS 175.79]